MQICVLGAGYVGLVTAVCVADFGHDVRCLDIDEERIESLKRGEVPFYEPGLDELMKKNAAAGRFDFTTDKRFAVEGADVVYIAVGTPMNPVDGTVNLEYVEQAAKDIAPLLAPGTIVVDKSTVPVGTARKVKAILLENGAPEDVEVLSNPEFLREGTAVGDFIKPDRVVIGSDSESATMKLASVYQPLIDDGRQILITSIEAAELVKYASNAFLALKVTFINEIALLADKIGIDATEVAKGIGLDSRIGAKFLRPGPGYGGSCLPKDTNGLIHIADEFGAKLNLVKTAIETNDDIPLQLVNRVEEAAGGLKGKKIGVLGLAFKGGTDDVRYSPAIRLINGFIGKGASVKAFDPKAEKLARRELKELIEYATSEFDALSGADIAVIATEWPQFGQIELAKIAELLDGNILADFRNLFDPEKAKAAGLVYLGMGRI
jgi:UDPglucose 6-dehydrogenase